MLPTLARHPAFAVVGIASRDLAKAKPFANQYGCQAMSYTELVESKDIDAVYVPLPTGLHGEWVERCLHARKHVLCEKSLATTLSEVQSLVTQAREHHVLLMESFQFRFHSQHRYVKELLASGKLGDIRCFRSSFGFPPFPDSGNIRYNKELGGGALLDAGAYTLKAVEFMMGRGFRVKAASLWRPSGAEVDFGGGAYLENEDGVIAELAFGFDHFYQCNYEIWGSKGRLLSKRAFTAPPGFSPEVLIETQSTSETVTLQPDDHFYNMLSYYAACATSEAFEDEYDHCLTQARQINRVLELCHG